jgi:hypothetical protein
MMGERPKPQGEEPRSEPEIIPPGHAERGTPRMRVFVDTRSTERIYVAKPGPLGIILVILITGLLSTLMLVLVLGAFLIVLPAVVLFVAAAIVAGLLRDYFQRAP